MDKQIAGWLRALYDDAIRETKENIENEKIWGHQTGLLEDYIEVLEELKANLGDV